MYFGASSAKNDRYIEERLQHIMKKQGDRSGEALVTTTPPPVPIVS
jgi:hypothetical protein